MDQVSKQQWDRTYPCPDSLCGGELIVLNNDSEVVPIGTPFVGGYVLCNRCGGYLGDPEEVPQRWVDDRWEYGQTDGQHCVHYQCANLADEEINAPVLFGVWGDDLLPCWTTLEILDRIAACEHAIVKMRAELEKRSATKHGG